jgi:hypothetical protein
MNINKIMTLGEYTYEEINKFCKMFHNENTISTFLDWNAKDVLGHIIFWIDYSGRKLDCIKSNKQFDDISNFETINKETYDKNKKIKIYNLYSKLDLSFLQYKKAIKLYTDNELLSKTFPTGFSFELWRYMAMDIYIHPMMHLMYHYLKTGNNNEFINIIDNSINNFLEYSNNDINVFKFEEYYENQENRINQFKKVKEEKEINNVRIKKIIEINME